MEANRYQLNCPNLGVSINCQLVTPLARLLEVMLRGWQLHPQNMSADELDIITQHQEKYLVAASGIGFQAEHGDLISSFNELLIAITYLTCAKGEELILIHGGAMITPADNNSDTPLNLLFLGGHKAGKSTYLAKHCGAGAVFVSDDLLIINQQGQLVGLGFPLRLRRPIADEIVELYGASQLLAGHSLAYLGPQAIQLQEAGVGLHLDDLYLLEDYTPKAIPQSQWLTMIEERIIPIPQPDTE